MNFIGNVVQRRDERLKTFARGGADGDHLSVWKAGSHQRQEIVTLRLTQAIDLVDGDELGFFKLLAEDVRRLRRETSVAAPQDLSSMFRLAKYGQRPKVVAVPEEMPQRKYDGRHQIGAAADWLREDDVGLVAGTK